MNDCAGMPGKPEVIRFEMGTGFISAKMVVETKALALIDPIMIVMGIFLGNRPAR